MDEPYEFGAHYTIIGLEREVRTAEAAGLILKDLATSEGKTVGVFEIGKVPLRSLALWVDPTGTAAGPRGAVLICRGTAYVSGSRLAVAAFRKP